MSDPTAPDDGPDPPVREPTPPTDVRGIELPEHLRRIRSPVPAPLRHLAKRGFRAYGMATAGRRPLADFLIVGAKKAGTSSLMNWLVVHPGVARSFPPVQRLKSPHYFDINYWRGSRWYRSHFPSERTRRGQARQTGTEPLVGEASPYYLFHPAAAGRAARDVPSARIIVSLRDPVARAYSNFWDRRANGTESLATFEDALAAEPGRLAGVDEERLVHDPRYYSFEHDNHSYLARGCYADQVARWLDAFDRDQVLILRAESLFEEPEKTFTTVQQFLGLPLVQTPALRPYNQRSHPRMTVETKARLADYYRPHNAALYAVIGQDMGWEAGYPA